MHFPVGDYVHLLLKSLLPVTNMDNVLASSGLETLISLRWADGRGAPTPALSYLGGTMEGMTPLNIQPMTDLVMASAATLDDDDDGDHGGYDVTVNEFMWFGKGALKVTALTRDEGFAQVFGFVDQLTSLAGAPPGPRYDLGISLCEDGSWRGRFHVGYAHGAHA